MKIAHILGDWSRNIGNAFFQLGGLHVLNQVAPGARIGLVAEQPGYPSYWNPKGGNPKNYFDMTAEMDADYLVLMGPMFRPEIFKIWEKSLEKSVSNGVKLILLGVAAMRYDEASLDTYRRFLEKFPPFVMTTRDSDTCSILGGFAQHAFDGIDFGFFVSDLYRPLGLRTDSPTMAFNFDKIPEPEFRAVPGDGQPSRTGEDARRITIAGNDWEIRTSSFRTGLASWSRYLMFLEGLLFSQPNPDQIQGMRIIRTDHRPHPMLRRKTYRARNILVNDTPYPYLEVYGHAKYTFSNRIHACVASLSYGNSAMLFSGSPRIRMLERVGLGEITQKPVQLDQDLIAAHKAELIAFLKTHVT